MLRLVLTEWELLAVDGAIPELGLLPEVGFALAWHGLIRVSCMNRAFARFNSRGADQNV